MSYSQNTNSTKAHPQFLNLPNKQAYLMQQQPYYIAGLNQGTDNSSFLTTRSQLQNKSYSFNQQNTFNSDGSNQFYSHKQRMYKVQETPQDVYYQNYREKQPIQYQNQSLSQRLSHNSNQPQDIINKRYSMLLDEKTQQKKKKYKIRSPKRNKSTSCQESIKKISNLLRENNNETEEQEYKSQKHRKLTQKKNAYSFRSQGQTDRQYINKENQESYNSNKKHSQQFSDDSSQLQKYKRRYKKLKTQIKIMQEQQNKELPPLIEMNVEESPHPIKQHKQKFLNARKKLKTFAFITDRNDNKQERQPVRRSTQKQTLKKQNTESLNLALKVCQQFVTIDDTKAIIRKYKQYPKRKINNKKAFGQFRSIVYYIMFPLFLKKEVNSFSLQKKSVGSKFFNDNIKKQILNAKNFLYYSVKDTFEDILQKKQSLNIQSHNEKSFLGLNLFFSKKASNRKMQIKSIINQLLDNILINCQQQYLNSDLKNFLNFITKEGFYFPSGYHFKFVLERLTFNTFGGLAKSKQTSKLIIGEFFFIKCLLYEIMLHPEDMLLNLNPKFFKSKVPLTLILNQITLVSVMYYLLKSYFKQFFQIVHGNQLNLPQEKKILPRGNIKIKNMFPTLILNTEIKPSNFHMIPTQSKNMIEDLIKKKEFKEIFQDKEWVEGKHKKISLILKNLEDILKS